MSIDVSLSEMFNEKNQLLFINKLMMDLDNNTDTFKMATKNIVMIEIAKLLSSLRRIYNKYSITIDDEKIKSLLNKTKTVLLEDIEIVIADKQSNNREYVESSRSTNISKKYLKDYHNYVDETEESFEGSLSLAIKEDTDVQLYNSLIALYPCVNEEMHYDMLTTINVDFTNNLINRIVDEGRHRSMTLKNMSEETYQKYLELSKSSATAKSGSKIKSKKNN